MKTFIIVLFTAISLNWAISKPMESIENYNVMLLHGAYGSKKGFSADSSLPEAYNAGGALENGATLGGYTNGERITQWLSSEIFEETQEVKALITKKNVSDTFFLTCHPAHHCGVAFYID